MQQFITPSASKQPPTKRRIIILGLLLLTMLISGGVLLWQAHKPVANLEQGSLSPPAAPHEATSPQPAIEAVDPNEGYLVMKEWGVRLKLPASVPTLQYVLLPRGSQELIGISSDELVALDAHCAAMNAPLGLFERTTTPRAFADGKTRPPLRILEGYYYYFTGPQASCLSGGANAPAHMQLLESQSAAVAEAVNSLELIPQ